LASLEFTCFANAYLLLTELICNRGTSSPHVIFLGATLFHLNVGTLSNQRSLDLN